MGHGKFEVTKDLDLLLPSSILLYSRCSINVFLSIDVCIAFPKVFRAPSRDCYA